MHKLTATAATLACLASATLVAVAAADPHANPSPAASHGDHMGMAATKSGKAMVKITAPKLNDTLKPGKVTVKWNFSKGGEVAHVHLHLDGGKPMPQMGKSTELTLTPGKHTIMVTGATASHKEIGPSDTVTVMVK